MSEPNQQSTPPATGANDGAKPAPTMESLMAEIVQRLDSRDKAEADYRKANNDQMANLRRKVDGKDGGAADGRTGAASSPSPAAFDFAMMAKYLEARSKVAPEQLSALESAGLSPEQQIAVLSAMSAKGGPTSAPREAAPSTSPAAGRVSGSAQPSSSQHPRSLHEYMLMSAEARKAVDADSSFELGKLPSR